MTKEVIAVDLDEVLSPLHDLVFAHHNAVYGTDYPIHDPSGKYYLQEYSQENDSGVLQKLKRFVKTEEFKAVKPLKNAVAVISGMREDYDLVIITSRQDFYYDVTRAWLKEHFPKVFKEVMFTQYRGKKGVDIPKSAICKQLGANYIIEDNLQHAFECAEAGIHTVLFSDYPWNQADRLPADVVRCKDWLAVKRYFDDRA